MSERWTDEEMARLEKLANDHEPSSPYDYTGRYLARLMKGLLAEVRELRALCGEAAKFIFERVEGRPELEFSDRLRAASKGEK